MSSEVRYRVRRVSVNSLPDIPVLIHTRPLETHSVHDRHVHIDLHGLATVMKQTEAAAGEECDVAVHEAWCGLKGG